MTKKDYNVIIDNIEKIRSKILSKDMLKFC